MADSLLEGAGKSAGRIPRLRIPRVGAVDVVLHDDEGFTLVFVQRSDHLAAYKHLVGQLVGCLAHLHRSKTLELRQALEKVKGFKGGAALDVPEVAKRLIADAKAGKARVVIATERPEVPQTFDHLVDNFKPVLQVLKTWMIAPVGQHTLCESVEAWVVDLQASPVSIGPLFKDVASAAAPKKKAAKKTASKKKATKKAAKKKATKKA